MPPTIGKDGRPLTQRIGSDIPFLSYEEIETFTKIQELVTEYNARSKKRIFITHLGSDGGITLLGTKSVLSNVLQSSLVSSLVTGVESSPSWFADTERETFKVPIVYLPTEEEMRELDEAGCEDQIAQLLNLTCYPVTNHFTKRDSPIPYCWPQFVSPKAPSTLSVRNDNGTGLTFASRLDFLLYILKVMIFAYFHNLLFRTLGVVEKELRSGVFMMSSTFSTKMPFATDGLLARTRVVVPCPRKLGVADRKERKKNKVVRRLVKKKAKSVVVPTNSSESQVTGASQVSAKDTGKPLSVLSPNPSVVEVKRAVCTTAQKNPTKGMPFLQAFDSQLGEVSQKDGRPFKLEVSRQRRLRVYKRISNGREVARVLCTCPDTIDCTKIQTIRCPCGYLNHVACMPSTGNKCTICSSKSK